MNLSFYLMDLIIFYIKMSVPHELKIISNNRVKYVPFQSNGYNRYLSNFNPSTISYKSHTFPSIEHAFQAAKYIESGADDGIIKQFCIGGKFHHLPGWKIKRLGSRAEFIKNSLRLNVVDWNKQRISIMLSLINERFLEDKLFRNMLRHCHQHNYILLHTIDKFWGGKLTETGVKGSNHLGKIMNIVAERFDAFNYESL